MPGYVQQHMGRCDRPLWYLGVCYLHSIWSATFAASSALAHVFTPVLYLSKLTKLRQSSLHAMAHLCSLHASTDIEYECQMYHVCIVLTV